MIIKNSNFLKGPEEYSAMRDQYYRTAEAMIAVFSLTSRTTINEVNTFVEAFLRVKDLPKSPLIVIGNPKKTCRIFWEISGNKSDLTSEREVSYQEGQDLAKCLGGIYIETSAKDRTNVDEAFFELIR